jgi:pimeloyl-ACP methyl ester carboxylesterase
MQSFAVVTLPPRAVVTTYRHWKSTVGRRGLKTAITRGSWLRAGWPGRAAELRETAGKLPERRSAVRGSVGAVKPAGAIVRQRRAGLLFGVTLLASGCGGVGQDGAAGQAPTSSASTVATPPGTAATIVKPCLQGTGSAKPFRFRTSAGATLVGVVLGRGRTGLVLGHQRGSDLCEWLPRAQAFAEQGYQVLAFDFQGYGDSQPGSGTDTGIDTDVVAAAEQLRRRGATRIVLIGSSMGGTAVLSAATRIRPPVAGVVSLSGPTVFQDVDAGAAISRLRVPVLLVVGADDELFVDDAKAMYRAASTRDKRLLIIPGGGHGTSMLEFGEDAPKVLAAVRKFIADHTRR